jgi:crossover junction endodeoxyribonuclease RusA
VIGFTIAVPLRTNPLSLNSRQHWRTKAHHTKVWRTYAGIHAYGKPAMPACDVTLTWFVTDSRRRDEDNIYPLLKALCDGLVDAGIVPDDTAAWMGKACRIERAPEGTPHAYMELKVEPRNGNQTQDDTRRNR